MLKNLGATFVSYKVGLHCNLTNSSNVANHMVSMIGFTNFLKSFITFVILSLISCVKYKKKPSFFSGFAVVSQIA